MIIGPGRTGARPADSEPVPAPAVLRPAPPGPPRRTAAPGLRRFAAVGAALAAALPGDAGGGPAGSAGAAQPGNEIDALMERVLDNRDASWRRAGDFVLREVETLAVEGPADLPIAGFRREYEWYVRDDVVVRSPRRFDGVDVGEAERREYEAEWLRRRERRAAGGRPAEEDAGAPAAGPPEAGQGPLAPEFISDAYYFMEFEFEPGNYYLAGRETLAGREVVRIEYYPTDFFGAPAEADESERERRIRRGFAKTSLVTLWVDPEIHQVVRYTFDNVGLDFLPGRWLVRVDGWRASIEMAQPIGGVWLPRRMALSGRATVAAGTFDLRFVREYADYREALTGGRLVGAGAARGDRR